MSDKPMMVMTSEEIATLQARVEDKTCDYGDLVQKYDRFLWSICRKYSKFLKSDNAVELSDVYQAAVIGMMAAQKTFDPYGGCNFAGWMLTKVQQEIRSMLGLQRLHITSVYSLDEPIVSSDGDDNSIRLDFQKDESIKPMDEFAEDVERREVVQDELDKLRPEQSQVIKAQYYDGLSREEIARDLGVDVTTCTHIRQAAMIKLRRSEKLKTLWMINHKTRFVGADTFNRTHTSAVELSAIDHERYERMVAGIQDDDNDCDDDLGDK